MKIGAMSLFSWMRPRNFLVAGVILFFMPFVQLKCASTTLAENTGFGMAFGEKWRISFGDYEQYLDREAKNTDKKTTRSIENQPNWFLILALFFAIVGFVISFFEWRAGNLGIMCASILAALLLISAMIYLKLEWSSALRSEKQSEEKLSWMIKLQFTAWYYISVVFFSVSAFIAYRLNRQELQDAIERSLEFDFQKEVNG